MVITKKIIVPAGQKEEELELTVEAEANQYIPFALDEVNLDFQMLGPAPNNPDEVEVLIAASRKEKVEDRVAVAESAGLKARVMDVESYATQEAFQPDRAVAAGQRPRPEHRARRHRRARHPLLCPAQQPVPVLPRPGVRRQPADAGHPARLQPVAARKPSRPSKNQGLPENYDNDVLQPFMETLALEITRALQFFFTSTSYNQVDQIVLAGGCALLPGLDELVAKRAGVATIVANPFAAMQTSERIRPRQLAQDAPMLMIATGLRACGSFE